MNPFKRGLFWILVLAGFLLAFGGVMASSSLYDLVADGFSVAPETLFGAFALVLLSLFVLAMPVVFQLLLDIPVYFLLRKKETRLDAQKFVFVRYGLVSGVSLASLYGVFLYLYSFTDDLSAEYQQLVFIACLIFGIVIALGYALWRIILKKKEKRG